MEKRCGNCASFIQHYAFFEGRFRKIFVGHCRAGKRKNLDQGSAACEDFIPGEPVEDQMVTREYLTKTLLEKLLSMALWKE